MAFAALSAPRPAAAPQVAPAVLLRVATLLVLWALWEAVARSGLVFKGVVPSSFAILDALVRLLGEPAFYGNFVVTAGEVAAATTLGGGLGIVAGLVLGGSRFLGRAYEPYVHYLAPVPKIVLLPVLMVLFGVGPSSKVALGALSCFFPMALSIAAGMRQLNPVLLRVGRSFRLTRWQAVRLIYLPALVPPLATGLRLALGMATVGCLVAELKLSNSGLGFLAIQAYDQFAVPRMYAVIVVIFVLAAAGNRLIGGFVRLPGDTR